MRRNFGAYLVARALLGPECWELVAAVGRGETVGLEWVTVAMRGRLA